ncbi:hypothetical protein MED222_06020 [Vibrio sp. MED222]|nr:hypothetical protein MED222_06020 [Vibrio sp. MED222]
MIFGHKIMLLAIKCGSRTKGSLRKR